MKIFILYFEIAPYNLPCFKELSKDNEVFLINYKVNTDEAPFDFNFDFPISTYLYSDLSFKKIIEIYDRINPDLVFCAGWVNKYYLYLCKHKKASIKILGFDTIWKNNLEQKIKSLFFKFKYGNVFDYVFVPGSPQKELALNMGFKMHQIKTGAYTCDFDFFRSIGENFKCKKNKFLPKRFIYVGRYIHRKGIFDLWEAFKALHQEYATDWELWCVGTGPCFKDRMIHSKIKHFGFLQQNEILKLMENTSVFILPSHHEPWGMVVQEFASAGFPLLLSKEVSSSSMFLEDNKNGFSFKSHDKTSIKSALSKIIQMKDDDLIKMGQISVKLASKLTPKDWAKNLTDV